MTCGDEIDWTEATRSWKKQGRIVSFGESEALKTL
jgi:hypothetical protein